MVFKHSFLIVALLTFLIPAVSHAAEPKSDEGKVSGIDKTLFSPDITPGENFYWYANQEWLDKTDIPGDKSNYGIFTVLDDKTRSEVRALIEEAAASKAEPGTAAQKVGDLYKSVLDMKARNDAGIKPIQPLLRRINKVKSVEDLAKTLGFLMKSGVYGPLAPYINADARNSDQYTVYVTQSGLTMPDRDYYLEDDERYTKLRAELLAYVADMLAATGAKKPEPAAKAIYELERTLAEKQWTKTENRDPEKTYNKKTSEEMQVLLGDFPWATFAKASGLTKQKEFVVRQPSYLEQLGKLLTEVDLNTWKNYLRLQVIDGYSSSLTEELELRHFQFHSTAISGVTEQEPLWKRGVNVTSSVLGELVGQLYVEKYFKPAAKERMNELVENLKKAFAERITTRDWMGKGTQKQALEKLSMFTTKIGYPDEWKDYTALKIESPILATNILASSKFETKEELKKLGGPIDRNEWHMTPQTINAYYNPVMNEIVFPAAILQPPFFNMEADNAVNYGAIGAVIGHELSHGFDDKGSKYDGKGNLRKWWTETDREEFERRAEGLVAQYDAFEPVKGNFVNGKLTLGENIGDLGGLSVAYKAYRLSLNGKEAPVIDGLTGDQRFFLGWSQIWRRLYREPELLKRLVTDPHSPSEYRVNGIVRNMDAWYEAFGIKPTDALYLKPEDRVRIW
ncbi:MAG: M13 family metallopeptidase [Planctomycetaceae bacterium]|nr:M13 family metallopeptidase [Planctomycetaceae bacterium]